MNSSTLNTTKDKKYTLEDDEVIVCFTAQNWHCSQNDPIYALGCSPTQPKYIFVQALRNFKEIQKEMNRDPEPYLLLDKESDIESDSFSEVAQAIEILENFLKRIGKENDDEYE